MFTNFTWWHFFGTFLLFSVFYYPFILWFYFREEVKQLLRPAFAATSSSDASSHEQVAEAIVTPTVETTPQDTIIAALSNLQTDITQGVKAAKDAGVSKDQLMGLLKNILQKYPELKNTIHQVQINDLLVQESAKANYVLQQFEAYALWSNTVDSNS